MSGTSMDGIDATLADFSTSPPRIIKHHSIHFPKTLKSNILTLCQPSDNELSLMCDVDHQLGHLYAQCVNELLQCSPVSADLVSAIGNHGQTIRHYPNNQHPYTLQIGDPNILAWNTGITTVADFRRKDIAAHGQGAPLVPAFHHAVFSNTSEDRVILNIGGMANVSILSKTGDFTGFDTGPGNVLMDAWVQKHQNTAFDHNGDWANTGEIIPALLERLLKDPFFTLPPPKSTGRELFNQSWLDKHLSTLPTLEPVDVQATLCELTATTIASAIQEHAAQNTHVFVCGGGAYNLCLMNRIRETLTHCTVDSTDALDVNPQQVESLAFAWLAKQTLEKKPGNDPKTTGADAPVILGGIYLAN